MISKDESKSIFSMTVFIWLGFSIFSKILNVFSRPNYTLFKPDRSGGISCKAIWYKNSFSLMDEGNSSSIFKGVWIGGIPASWKMRSYYEKSLFLRSSYLSLLKSPSL